MTRDRPIAEVMRCASNFPVISKTSDFRFGHIILLKVKQSCNHESTCDFISSGKGVEFRDLTPISSPTGPMTFVGYLRQAPFSKLPTGCIERSARAIQASKGSGSRG